ncbi:hypothetical protein ACFLV3_04320 [Chloroflexota bacterium]
MEKINLPLFYQLGALLRPLTEMEAKDTNRVDIYLAANRVTGYVRSLLESYPTLIVCRNSGEKLIKATEEMVAWLRSTPHEEWEKEDYSINLKCSQLINEAKEFQTLLSAELLKLETYYVSQKGIYDTTALIIRTEHVLPISILNKIDKRVVVEIRESGKCLAFDCATASGFHIMRATELVMHKYYLHVCNPKSKKRLANWGVYIGKLGQSQAQEIKEVVAILQQIKDRHRNLIMHPDIVLTPDEAFILFEIAQGAIIAMASALPMPKK